MVCSIFKSVCGNPIVPPIAGIMMFKIGSHVIDGIQLFQKMEQTCPEERSLFQIKTYSPQCQEHIGEFCTSGMYAQIWTTSLVALMIFAALYNHRLHARPVRAVHQQASQQSDRVD